MKKLKNLILVLLVTIISNAYAQNFTILSDRQVGTLGNTAEYTGIVTGMDAIGGECSGIMMITAEGIMIELDSDTDEVKSTLLDLMDTDKKVTARGSFKIVEGVERIRAVLVVDSLSIEKPVLHFDPSLEPGLIVGMGGPLMYNAETGRCLQSLNTRQTAILKNRGFVVVNYCPRR